MPLRVPALSLGPALVVALTGIALNLLASHFFPGPGWLISPLVFSQTVRPLNAAAARDVWLARSALILLGLQDQGMARSAGGTEGRGWLLAMTLISALVVWIQLFDVVVERAPQPWPRKAAAMLLFPLGVVLYLYCLLRLGP